MKKLILLAALFSGISFTSNAVAAPSKKVNKIARTKTMLFEDTWYCQTVSFSCGSTAVCGRTFNEYVECLEDAKSVFEYND